jgi:hypothetical protein
MDRRQFMIGSASMAALLATSATARAGAFQSTPAADGFPALQITLTDTSLEFPQPLMAGRYAVTVSNTGTIGDSHFLLGKIPDAVTDEEYAEWFASEDDTEALSFEELGFVGVPDWPAPGGSVSGVIDLEPGRYVMLDLFGGRGFLQLVVDGEFAPAAEPAAEVDVELLEMELRFSETAFTTEPARWKVTNTGAMAHEVAVVPVDPGFTEEHLERLLALPDDATPPADIPEFVYQPVAAIGVLGSQRTSWLDVTLPPGRYLAACMLPFGTGYPHVMDGMYFFIDVA